jgi:hypothetical protein
MISRRAVFAAIALALASIVSAFGGASRIQIAEARKRRGRRRRKTYQY